MRRYTPARLCGILFVALILALVPVSASSAAKPSKVRNFRLICYGNKSAFLAWNKAKNASYYLIYSYDAANEKYTKLAKSTALHCQVKNLKKGKRYRLVIQGVYSRKGKTVKGAYSDPIKIVGRKVTLKGVHGRRWNVTANRTFWAKNLSTGKRVKIKKGATGITVGYHDSTPVVTLKKGVQIKTVRRNFNYGNLAITKSYKHYTKAQAELLVNQRGYSSRTNWLVWISQYTSSIHIFKGSQGQWKRTRVAMCVIGYHAHTPQGIYHMLHYTSSFGKTGIRFSWNPSRQWGLTFHRRTDRNTRGAYSHGCIRLGDQDLDYLVKNCPLGTTVVSY